MYYREAKDKENLLCISDKCHLNISDNPFFQTWSLGNIPTPLVHWEYVSNKSSAMRNKLFVGTQTIPFYESKKTEKLPQKGEAFN